MQRLWLYAFLSDSSSPAESSASAAFFPHQLSHGFGKLVKKPRPSLNNFTVINAAGFFGQHLFVLADQKCGVAVLGFALRWYGVCRHIGCTIVKG